MPNILKNFLLKNFFGFTNKDVKAAYKGKALFGDRNVQTHRNEDESIGFMAFDGEEPAVNNKRNIGQRYIAGMNLSAACVNQFAHDIPKEVTPYEMACVLQKAVELKACGAELFTELRLVKIKENIAAKLYKESSQKEFADAIALLPQKPKNLETEFLESTNMLEVMRRSFFPEGKFVLSNGTPNQSDVLGSGDVFEELRKNIDFSSAYACRNAKNNDCKAADNDPNAVDFNNCLLTNFESDTYNADAKPTAKDLFKFFKMSSLHVGESGDSVERIKKSALMSMFELNAALIVNNKGANSAQKDEMREKYRQNMYDFINAAKLYIERLENNVEHIDDRTPPAGVNFAMQNIEIIQSCLLSAKSVLGLHSSSLDKLVKRDCDNLIKRSKNVKRQLARFEVKESPSYEELSGHLSDISKNCRTNIRSLADIAYLQNGLENPETSGIVDVYADSVNDRVNRVRSRFVPKCNPNTPDGLAKYNELKYELNTLGRLLYDVSARSPDYFIEDAPYSYMQKPPAGKSGGFKPMIVDEFGDASNGDSKLLRDENAPVKNTSISSRIGDIAGFCENFSKSLNAIFGEGASSTASGLANANTLPIGGEMALKFLSYRQSLYQEMLNASSGRYFCDPADVEEIDAVMENVRQISSILTKHSSQILPIHEDRDYFHDEKKAHVQPDDFMTKDDLSNFDSVVNAALQSVEKDYVRVVTNSPSRFISDLDSDSRTKYMAEAPKIAENLGGIRVEMSLRSRLDSVLYKEEERDRMTTRGDDRFPDTNDITIPPRKLFFNGGQNVEDLMRSDFVINNVKVNKSAESGSFGVLVEARRVAECAKQRAMLLLQSLNADETVKRDKLLLHITNLESRLCSVNAGISLCSAANKRLALHMAAFSKIDYEGPNSWFGKNIVRPATSLYRVVPNVDSGEVPEYINHMKELDRVYGNPAEVANLKDGFVTNFIMSANKSSVDSLGVDVNGVKIPSRDAIAGMNLFPDDWELHHDDIENDIKSNPDACVRHIIAEKALKLEMSATKNIGTEGNSERIETMFDEVRNAIGADSFVEKVLLTANDDKTKFLNDVKKIETVKDFVAAITNIAMEVKAFGIVRHREGFSNSKFYASKEMQRIACIHFGEVIASFQKLHRDLTEEETIKLGNLSANLQTFVSSSYPAKLDHMEDIQSVLDIIWETQTQNGTSIAKPKDFTRYKTSDAESVDKSRQQTEELILNHIGKCNVNMHSVQSFSARVGNDIKEILIDMSGDKQSAKDRKIALCKVSLHLRQLADAKRDAAYNAGLKTDSLEKLARIKFDKKIAEFKRSHSPLKAGYAAALSKKTQEAHRASDDFIKMHEDRSCKMLDSVNKSCLSVSNIIPLDLLPLNEFAKMRADGRIPSSALSNTSEYYDKELDRHKDGKLSVGDAVAVFAISGMSSAAITRVIEGRGILSEVEAEVRAGVGVGASVAGVDGVVGAAPANNNAGNISPPEEPPIDYNDDDEPNVNNEIPFYASSAAGAVGAGVAGVTGAAAVSAVADYNNASSQIPIYAEPIPKNLRQPKDVALPTEARASRAAATPAEAVEAANRERLTRIRGYAPMRNGNNRDAAYAQKGSLTQSTAFIAQNDAASLDRVNSFKRVYGETVSALDELDRQRNDAAKKLNDARRNR